MEEIEQDDAARGLDASPGASGVLPPWIRATYAVQEDFDRLNEGERAGSVKKGEEGEGGGTN